MWNYKKKLLKEKAKDLFPEEISCALSTAEASIIRTTFGNRFEKDGIMLCFYLTMIKSTFQSTQ